MSARPRAASARPSSRMSREALLARRVLGGGQRLASSALARGLGLAPRLGRMESRDPLRARPSSVSRRPRSSSSRAASSSLLALRGRPPAAAAHRGARPGARPRSRSRSSCRGVLDAACVPGGRASAPRLEAGPRQLLRPPPRRRPVRASCAAAASRPAVAGAGAPRRPRAAAPRPPSRSARPRDGVVEPLGELALALRGVSSSSTTRSAYASPSRDRRLSATSSSAVHGSAPARLGDRRRRRRSRPSARRRRSAQAAARGPSALISRPSDARGRSSARERDLEQAREDDPAAGADQPARLLEQRRRLLGDVGQQHACRTPRPRAEAGRRRP